MQNFGLADLGWIALILIVATAVWMEAPQWIWGKCAPVVRAFFRGDVVRVTVRPGDQTSSVVSVRPLQNQIQTGEPKRNEPAHEPPSLQNVDRAALINMLADLRQPDGSYWFSSNEILRIVGGTAAEVKAQIATRRPKPPTSKTAPSLRRPQNGW